MTIFVTIFGFVHISVTISVTIFRFVHISVTISVTIFLYDKSVGNSFRHHPLATGRFVFTNRYSCLIFEVIYSLTIFVGKEFFLNSQYATTMTVDKAQHLHCFCHYHIAIIVYIWEIDCISTPIKSAVVGYLNMVFVLIELNRAVTAVITVTDGIHQQFSSSPVGIVHHIFLTCR